MLDYCKHIHPPGCCIWQGTDQMELCSPSSAATAPAWWRQLMSSSCCAASLRKTAALPLVTSVLQLFLIKASILSTVPHSKSLLAGTTLD